MSFQYKVFPQNFAPSTQQLQKKSSAQNFNQKLTRNCSLQSKYRGSLKNESINPLMRVNKVNAQYRASQRSIVNLPMQRRATSETQKIGSIYTQQRKESPENLRCPLNLNQQQQSFVGGSFLQNRQSIKEDIQTTNSKLKHLKNNNKFFQEECEKKLQEFMELVHLNVREKIYSKSVKQNFHFIYKHYENMQRTNSNQAQSQLRINLQKQQGLMDELEKGIKEIEKENSDFLDKLTKDINKEGILKDKKQIVDNLDKDEILQKINDLEKDNEKLDDEFKNLQNWKNQQIYKIKYNHELSQRKQMEQRAIELALEYTDERDLYQRQLSEEVKLLLQNLQYKNQLKNASPYYVLLQEKEKLQQELNQLKTNK